MNDPRFYRYHTRKWNLSRIRFNNKDINQIKVLRTFRSRQASSLAENIGIQVGDIVISINDQSVISATGIIDQVTKLVWAVSTLSHYYARKTITVHVKIKEYNECKSLLQ